MAEDLILPEANQILLLTADGLQWANYLNVSYETQKTVDWSASTEVFTFRFRLTFILKIENIRNRKPQLQCITAQTDLSSAIKLRIKIPFDV